MRPEKKTSILLPIFFIDIIVPAALWPWGWLSL